MKKPLRQSVTNVEAEIISIVKQTSVALSYRIDKVIVACQSIFFLPAAAPSVGALSVCLLVLFSRHSCNMDNACHPNS